MKTSNVYCNSLTKYSRFLTRVVNIGQTPMGGNNPIRIQSMTTTDTMNTEDTINQSIRMIEAGCEYVRITAPSINEARNLKKIKDGLKFKGYNTPLIADIHFTPNAALIAAEIVPKVRINPGNYADKKQFKKFEISDSEYKLELERINDKFLPLVKVCKENGTVMRIGSNHGSLSDRIMNRYGDTPLGMVESALEFIRICQENNYHDIVLSMKSSNPIVMVNAYRLLVNKMIEFNMNYPLHLGVTEAGEGLDGRIKSSLGIGALLEDGLGDTIRVSLTEEPEYEIPVAQRLVDRYIQRAKHFKIISMKKYSINPFIYKKRCTKSVLNIGGNNVPRVIIDLFNVEKVTIDTLSDLGYTFNTNTDKWLINELACDYIDIGSKEIDFNLPGSLAVIQEYPTWLNNKKSQFYPRLNIKEYLNSKVLNPILNFLSLNLSDLSDDLIFKIKNDETVVVVLNAGNLHGMAEQRRAFVKMMNADVSNPIIINRCYQDFDVSCMKLYSSTDIGGLLLDGLGDGMFIIPNKYIPLNNVNKICFAILQASRTRVTKTEYISCPSCGRTQFDLQKTTAMVRKYTDHLKGLKIAVMGCIVNGPGEMADADYGYVGTGKGIVSLYKKHEVVRANIKAENAIKELIQIIKDNNDWINPK